MFDIAWSELALIGAVALVVIGPKDLPKVMRVMGQWTRKARLLANEFQHNFDEMVRQADLEDVRRQVQAVNPVNLEANLKAKVESMVDAKGIAAAMTIDPAAAAAATATPAPAGAMAAEGASVTSDDTGAVPPPVSIPADPASEVAVPLAAAPAPAATVPGEASHTTGPQS
ncbi:MAG: twin-arginine translocase subunit TatB [Telmatospirillum sp.]|nr:twin-arginine translocase subunit TatB [Telmatospirillum sp.]